MFGIDRIPNLRTFYLWLDDVRTDKYILEKDYLPSRLGSARTQLVKQNSQGMMTKGQIDLVIWNVQCTW